MEHRDEYKENVFGEKYIETKDEHGNVVQISKLRDSALGGEYYDTYDANMNYIGYSKPSTDSFGNRYIKTYDSKGNLLHTSKEIKSGFGDFWSIEDASGNWVGTQVDGVTKYNDKYEKKDTGSGSEDSSKSSIGAVGGNFGMIAAIVICFLAGMLALMLHDAEGREKIHHVVTPLVGIIPIGIVLLMQLKIKDIYDGIKKKLLIISLVLLVIMLVYYIWFTSLSMAWVIDNDLAYYSLWLLPYGFLFIYSLIVGKMCMEAKNYTPKSIITRVLNTTVTATILAYSFCPALMILRWEYYSESVKYMKLVVEFFTFIVVCAVGMGAATLASKIISKVTNGAFD